MSEATKEIVAGEVAEASAPVVTGEDNHKKLLLVEDNKEFRTFLKEQLEDFYQIVEAGDGEEARNVR